MLLTEIQPLGCHLAIHVNEWLFLFIDTLSGYHCNETVDWIRLLVTYYLDTCTGTAWPVCRQRDNIKGTSIPLPQYFSRDIMASILLKRYHHLDMVTRRLSEGHQHLDTNTRYITWVPYVQGAIIGCHHGDTNYKYTTIPWILLLGCHLRTTITWIP
jgi:hypothetical protein